MRFTGISLGERVVRMFAPVAIVPTFFLSRTPGAAASPVDTSRGATVLHGGWLDRLDQWHWRQRQRALEARLADATNAADLEARIREIGRGFPSPYY